MNYNGTVTNSYSSSTVSGYEYVGGLVGYSGPSGTVSDSYATGDVDGVGCVGGLVGYNYDTVSNSYATGSVSGTGYYAGGLVGRSDDTVSNSYATGSVSGDGAVGGLVGENYYGTVSDSYATGDVDGVGGVGGLVGWNGKANFFGGDTVSNCYATGNVSGDASVGGLVGENYYGTVSNSYSAGDVNGVVDVGGLVGYDDGLGDYTKSFWDNTVNPDVNGIGNGADPNVIGEPTANMQTEGTFTDAGWDFVGEVINGTDDIWRMCVNGIDYPALSWEFPLGDFVCPDGVNFIDFAILGLAWGSEQGDGNWNQDCDISEPNDNVINTLDLDVFVDNWLAGM